MTEKHSYSYTVLRYVHDVTTAEFVNVGLVLHSRAAGVLRVETRRTIGRIKDFFPDFNRRAFVSAMKAVNRAFDSIAKKLADGTFLDKDGDAGAFARRAVPIGDSSLQWSPIGTGLTSDIDRTFVRLYERFVSRYDTHTQYLRTDNDVWRPVRDKLDASLLARLDDALMDNIFELSEADLDAEIKELGLDPAAEVASMRSAIDKAVKAAAKATLLSAKAEGLEA
jgi:hypothetical protein